MPKTKSEGARSETASGGTPSLTAADMADWEAGRVTLCDLAKRSGVSIPAVSKAFARRRRRQASTKGSPARGAVPPGPGVTAIAPTGSELPNPPPFTREDANRLAKSAAFGALVQANAILASPAVLGPSGLKAAMAAAREAATMLELFGLVTPEDTKAATLPILRVVTMSEAEEAELRASVEARYNEMCPVEATAEGTSSPE